MDSGNDRRQLAAYTLPMAAFLAALGAVSLLKNIGGGFWLERPEYWVYPIQTLVCAALLLSFRREYGFESPRKILFTIAIAVVVFVLWIAPQVFLGFAPRLVGYDPDVFRSSPSLYWLMLLLRFARLVVIAPIVEELFWRGFLLRYFINERFTTVAFGTFSWFSFVAVTVGFTLVHLRADWPAAFITGALYNLVALRTKSLTSCLLAHAMTNLLLGLWIMQSRQWGFW
ncbi:MAG: CAAX prenyl protease-related protein [Chthoniobacterales bacterium]|nr:CAAX prenyl protease-related protein [Chthoniobacterales bacterium]